MQFNSGRAIILGKHSITRPASGQCANFSPLYLDDRCSISDYYNGKDRILITVRCPLYLFKTALSAPTTYSIVGAAKMDTGANVIFLRSHLSVCHINKAASDNKCNLTTKA